MTAIKYEGQKKGCVVAGIGGDGAGKKKKRARGVALGFSSCIMDGRGCPL